MTCGRTLYDMTQLLESADGADERVRRVLELLRDLVPYEQCAMLEARLGHEPHVVLVPETSPDERIVLTERCSTSSGSSSTPNAPAGTAAARPERGAPRRAARRARRGDRICCSCARRRAEYTEEHLRALSVVAAKLAAYFTMLRARAELAELARERDEARRAVEAAQRAKDEFLALVSHELRTPLDSILASTDRLRASGSDPVARARTIDELERNVQTQVKLVDEILDLGSKDLGLNLSTSASGLLPPSPSPDRRLLTGVRVLLIDYDLEIRESFQSVLEGYGAEVKTAASAPEALAAFDRSRPDVLLFGDLAMSVDSAYDAIREVTARSSGLPIVSFSAWRLDERDRALAAGVRLHFAKPLELGVLVDTVAKLTGRTQEKGSLKKLRK